MDRTSIAMRPIDINKTIRTMRHREIQRKVNGHHKKSTTSKTLWLSFVAISFLALLGSSVLTIDIEKFWQELTLVTLLIPLLVYIIVQIALVIRWCLYWVVG
jgi:hypothetical protein